MAKGGFFIFQTFRQTIAMEKFLNFRGMESYAGQEISKKSNETHNGMCVNRILKDSIEYNALIPYLQI